MPTPYETASAAIAELDDEQIANLLLTAVDWGDPETETPNRHLAVEMAEAFGPDHSQVMYRFAVLMTRVA